MNEITYNLFKIVIELKSGCVFKQGRTQHSTKEGAYTVLVDAEGTKHTICLWKN